MELHDFFDDGQSQTRAVISGAGLVSGNEGVKEGLTDILGDTASVVPQKQLEIAVQDTDRYPQSGSRRIVGQRILY